MVQNGKKKKCPNSTYNDLCFPKKESNLRGDMGQMLDITNVFYLKEAEGGGRGRRRAGALAWRQH